MHSLKCQGVHQQPLMLMPCWLCQPPVLNEYTSNRSTHTIISTLQSRCSFSTSVKMWLLRAAEQFKGGVCMWDEDCHKQSTHTHGEWKWDRANHLKLFSSTSSTQGPLHTALYSTCSAILTIFIGLPAHSHLFHMLLSSTLPWWPHSMCITATVEAPCRYEGWHSSTLSAILHKGLSAVIDGDTSSNTTPHMVLDGRHCREDHRRNASLQLTTMSLNYKDTGICLQVKKEHLETRSAAAAVVKLDRYYTTLRPWCFKKRNSHNFSTQCLSTIDSAFLHSHTLIHHSRLMLISRSSDFDSQTGGATRGQTTNTFHLPLKPHASLQPTTRHHILPPSQSLPQAATTFI